MKQADYGNQDDRMMVVGALRGYRFFNRTRYTAFGSLPKNEFVYSVAYSHQWTQEENVATCALTWPKTVIYDRNACMRCLDLWINGFRNFDSIEVHSADEDFSYTIPDSLVEQKFLASKLRCRCYNPGRLWKPNVGMFIPDELILGADIFTILVKYGDRHTSPAPDRRCVCGFYAGYTPGDTLNAPSTANSDYFGVVEATGGVILGERGFRAEKMRILALSTLSSILRNPPLSKYNWFNKPQDMIREFPPESYQHLLED